MTFKTYFAKDRETSSKAINTQIDRIGTRQASLNVDIHNIMVDIARHGQLHGDVTAAARLMNKLGTGLRRGMVLKTFEKFTPIVLEATGKVYTARQQGDRAKDKRPWDIDGLVANPWYELANRTADRELVSTGSLFDKINQLLKSYKTKVAKGNIEETEDAEIFSAEIIRLEEFIGNERRRVLDAKTDKKTSVRRAAKAVEVKAA